MSHRNSSTKHLMTEKLAAAHRLMARKSPKTNEHLARVAEMARKMSEIANEKMGTDFNPKMVHLAAGSHDLGKLKVRWLLNPKTYVAAKKLGIYKRRHVSERTINRVVGKDAPEEVKHAMRYHHYPEYPKTIPEEIKLFIGITKIADQFDSIIHRNARNKSKGKRRPEAEIEEEAFKLITEQSRDGNDKASKYRHEKEVIDLFRELYEQRKKDLEKKRNHNNIHNRNQKGKNERG